jgi:hypothetical protein
MDDAALVGVVNRPGQGLHQRGRRARLLRTAAQPGSQAAAVHIFQGKVRAARLLADLVDLHDVGVMQLGHGLRLAAEAGQLLRPAVRLGQDHLQSDDPAELRVAGLVDDAHAAAP